MRVLVAVSAAAVADSMIKPAAFRGDREVEKSRKTVIRDPLIRLACRRRADQPTWAGTAIGIMSWCQKQYPP
jgi:hypothetical protein